MDTVYFTGVYKRKPLWGVISKSKQGVRVRSTLHEYNHDYVSNETIDDVVLKWIDKEVRGFEFTFDRIEACQKIHPYVMDKEDPYDAEYSERWLRHFETWVDMKC